MIRKIPIPFSNTPFSQLTYHKMQVSPTVLSILDIYDGRFLTTPEKVQIFIDVLIYNHASHCLSKQVVLPPDKPIQRPSCQIISRITLINHNLTRNVSSYPLTNTLSTIPGYHSCILDRCTLYVRHYHSRGPAKISNPYYNPCYLLNHANNNTKYIERGLIRYHYLRQTLTLSCNITISQPHQLPHTKFENC